MISSAEDISFLEVSEAKKIEVAVQSACLSAVAPPVSRAASFHTTLVTPAATLNFVAWLPLLLEGSHRPNLQSSSFSFLAVFVSCEFSALV